MLLNIHWMNINAAVVWYTMFVEMFVVVLYYTVPDR